jgi:hypothetical protein
MHVESSSQPTSLHVLAHRNTESGFESYAHHVTSSQTIIPEKAPTIGRLKWWIYGTE